MRENEVYVNKLSKMQIDSEKDNKNMKISLDESNKILQNNLNTLSRQIYDSNSFLHTFKEDFNRKESS